ncbi:MAG: SH3 domain-containing protein [Cyanobacteria bacterium J06659_2]
MNFPIRSNRLYFAVLSVVFSLVGIKSAAATESFHPTPLSSDAQFNASLIAQEACLREYQERQPYARVITEDDPLLVRATPNGRVIGAIPKGWAVVTLELNSNGQWTRITSHWGEVTESDGTLFGSAPDFRSGWVATRYLEDLGEFCEKPMAMLESSLAASAQAQQYIANEDWLQLGDRIALVQPRP